VAGGIPPKLQASGGAPKPPVASVPPKKHQEILATPLVTSIGYFTFDLVSIVEEKLLNFKQKVFFNFSFLDVDECKMNENICADEDGTSRECLNVAGDYLCSNCEDVGHDVFSYNGAREGCCRIGRLI